MKHVPDHFTHADEPSGHCLLLIAAPTDAEIYGCFRAVSRKWRHSLLAERLWIEHDVPISSDFTSEHPPEAVQRIIAADRELILRIEVEIAGLLVSFSRSSGYGPFRQSFFDEIRIEQRQFNCGSEPTIGQVLQELRDRLQIGAAVLSEEIDDWTELMDLPNTSTVRGTLPF